jgi:tagatose-1,6-bisphosphate aldolase
MNNPRLTPGKIRRLQTAASPEGVFRILAVDHRGVLLRMMDRDATGHVPPECVTQLKLDIVRAIGCLATAVILDPQYSLVQAIAGGALAGNVGLLSSLDAEPRAPGSGAPRDGRPPWTVSQACQVGASGVKLYLPYHPDDRKRASAQEDLVRQVVDECAAAAMPLFLEPVAYSIDADAPADSARFADTRRRVAIETVRRLGALGPDVLKLQFPVDCRHEPRRRAWREACAEICDASPVPWALLSAGEPFDIFKTQLQVACEAGCSGFMAGRALWSEAATTAPDQRGKVLHQVIRPRIEALNQIADRHGHDWRDIYSLVAAAEQPKA